MRTIAVIFALADMHVSCSSPKNINRIDENGSQASNNVTIDRGRCILDADKSLSPVTNQSLKAIESIVSAVPFQSQCSEIIIKLKSIGGEVPTSRKIAAFLRSSNISTMVPPGRTCASACTIIFLGGVKRYVTSSWVQEESKLGFHRSTVKKINRRSRLRSSR
jgi:ClpP class serine protease